MDWTNGTVSFFRKKTGVPVIVHLGTEALNLFKDLPAEGVLFPYPERFAQEALGHNSKAVHRAYAKRALMKIPSLEDYEQRAAAKVQPAT